jgi:cobalamin biosynthesis protein CbiD
LLTEGTGVGAKVCTGAGVVVGVACLSPGARRIINNNTKAAIANAAAYFGLIVKPFLGSDVGGCGGLKFWSVILFLSS